MTKRAHCIVWFFIFLRFSAITCTDQQPNTYHIKMLRQNVERIKRSWDSSHVSPQHTSHVLRKRSAKNTLADDLLLTSLDAFCSTFKNDEKVSGHLRNKTPLRSRDISGYTRYKSDKKHVNNNSGFQVPEIFPIQILAERHNNSVWYILDIVHSRPFTISRIDLFRDIRPVQFSMPDNACGKNIVSKVRLMVDASGSVCNDVHMKKNKADFQLIQDGGDRDVVTISTDVCNFDKVRSERFNGVVEQKGITMPYISLTQTPLASSSLDTTSSTFDLEVVLEQRGEFTVRLALWDAFNQTNITQSLIHVHRNRRSDSDNPFNIFYDNNDDLNPKEQKQLLTVEFISQTSLDWRSFLGKFRIIIKDTQSQSGRRGKLFVSYTRGDYYQSKVIKKVRIERAFPVSTTSEGSSKEPLLFNPQKRILCLGNCTLRCEAYGSDIASVTFSTPRRNRRYVRYDSYLLPNNTGVAILNLGAASGEIEGDYQCTAVSSRGQTSVQIFELYTTRFTKIELIQVDLVDTFTMELKCVVRGDPTNMVISFTLYRQQDRWGDRSQEPGGWDQRLEMDGENLEKTTTYDKEKDLTTLTLKKIHRASIDFYDELKCTAKGKRGRDSKYALFPPPF